MLPQRAGLRSSTVSLAVGFVRSTAKASSLDGPTLQLDITQSSSLIGHYSFSKNSKQHSRDPPVA